MMDEKRDLLACPKCGGSDDLARLFSTDGFAYGPIEVPAQGPIIELGALEEHSGSVIAVGIACRSCGWMYKNDFGAEDSLLRGKLFPTKK